MTLFEWASNYEFCDRRFCVGKSKTVWESATVVGNTVRITRVCKESENGGKPFLLGLRYKERYADPNSKVYPPH